MARTHSDVSAQQLQSANKETQDQEGGSEDTQFRVSDVPNPNMGRSHIKLGLRPTKRPITMSSPDWCLCRRSQTF